jgi:hypothetical protein
MPTQRQEISASIQANFPDNTSQFITPARIRSEQGLFENYVVLNEQTASIIAQAVASSSAGAGFVTDAAFNAYTGSTNTFTGSIQTQVNALQAATGSYVTNAQTASMSVLSASYASSSTSASYALTASFALNAGGTINTGSFATTGSNTFNGTNTFTGSLNAQSASITFLTVGTIVSSSTIFSSGSNTLGDASNDVQTLWGTVNLPTGPLQVTGSVSSTSGFTGSLQGTSSFANSATSASYALSATSASYALNSTNAVSASYASASTSASFASNATSASYASSSTSASFANNATSASYALTASFALNGGGGTINTGSFATTGSNTFIGDQTVSGSVRISGSLVMNGLSPIQASHIKANDIQGVEILTNSGTTVATFGQGGGTGATFAGQINATAFSGSGALVTGVVSSSYAANSTSASFAISASWAPFVATNTGSLLTTASVSLNTITFTKGDGSTFPITVNTGSATSIDTGSLVTTASFNAYTGSTNTFTSSIQQQVNTLQSVTSSYVTNAQTGSFVTSAITGSSIITASVSLNTITFTEGDGTTFNITVDTGSGGGGGGMNLGANTFTGSQTIASASVYITPTGSTVQYLTESAVRGNLVFGNTNLAQSGSVIVTGSNNILLGIGVSTTGQGGWNGSRNVIITSPQYSGSVPSMNGTINLGNYIASGSGTGTNAISSTFANGGITVTNTSPSSNTTISTSNINATTTIRHAASGSTVANGNLTISTTNLGGSVLISTTGSSTAAKTIAQSMFVGGNITASLEAASNSNLANTIVLGSGLVVSGTLAASSLSGSTIVGQYNETGSLSDPSQVKFVVGTGTSATSRRTSFYVSQSGETVAVNLVPTTLNTQNTTTIQSTGSITNRIHTKQAGAMPAGGISSSFIISPEIGLEPTAANFKPILQRNLTGSIGQSGSYVFNIDFVNNVLVATSTDLYIGSGKISGFCIPGRTATVAATASIQNYVFNDSSMLPAISSSWDGTLYTVFAKHNGGASSSFAYTGTEFYHSGSTQ